MTFQQVPSMSAAVRLADDNVRMGVKCAVIDGDISRQREYFDLLAYRDSLVLFCDWIEKAENHITQSADCREAAGMKALLRQESTEGPDDLVAFIEHEGVSLLSAFVDQFEFHDDYFDGFARSTSGAIATDFGSGRPSAFMVSASSLPVAGMLFSS